LIDASEQPYAQSIGDEMQRWVDAACAALVQVITAGNKA